MITKSTIDKLVREIGVPYIDVICYQDHKEVFRYFTGQNVTGKELLYMYSCSKPITVVCALRLVEKGLLGLDDKVCKYLPDIATAFVMTGNKEKKVVGDQITLRHLFTMTAGFSYDLKTQPILELAKESKGKAELLDFIPKFVQTPLVSEPGHRFVYSICHDILGAVIETVSGVKFSQFVEQELFKPLKMKRACFDNSEKDVDEVYTVVDRAITKTDGNKILLPTPKYESGGAGLVCTVEDYIAFADALACGGISNNGYRVLKEQTIKELAKEQINNLHISNSFTCVQGDDYGYGLGVRIRKRDTKWGLEQGEFGWDGAAGSYVMIDPKRKISVFIGMHILEWPQVFNGKHLAIVESLYKEFFDN